jgi:hypothetical protein
VNSGTAGQEDCNRNTAQFHVWPVRSEDVAALQDAARSAASRASRAEEAVRQQQEWRAQDAAKWAAEKRELISQREDARRERNEARRHVEELQPMWILVRARRNILGCEHASASAPNEVVWHEFLMKCMGYANANASGPGATCERERTK